MTTNYPDKELEFQKKILTPDRMFITCVHYSIFIVVHNYHNCSLVLKRRQKEGWLAEQRLLSGYENIVGGID